MDAEQIPKNTNCQKRTDDSAQSAPKVEKPPAPPLRTIWGLAHLKRKFHERRAKYEDQTPEEKAAWRTANATVWIAVFTIVLAFVGGFTLYEVIAGGNDTKTLAEAAKKQAFAAAQQVGTTAALAMNAKTQADRTKDLADRMKEQADQTKIVADQAVVQAEAAKNAAYTASASLASSKETFHEQERPWLGVSALTVTQFDKNKPLRIDVGFINSGKTPALEVKHGTRFKFDPRFAATPDATWGTIFSMDPEQSVPPQGAYTTHMTMNQPLFDTQFDAIKAGGKFLYFYGEITYIDTSKSIQGETRYCIFLRMIDDKPDLAFCPGFNDLK